MRRESVAILTIVLTLVFIGFFSVYSALAANPYGEGYFIRHCIFLMAGFGAMFVCIKFDYHHLQSPLIYRTVVFITLVLLIAVLIPGVGTKVYNAQRWLDIGGIRFQPSELAKFTVILLLSVKLVTNQEVIGKFAQGYMPSLFIMSVFAALVFAQRDLGAPFVMCVTSFILFFVAGIRWYYLAMSLVPASGILWLLIIMEPYRVKRLTGYLDPWGNAGDESYQLIQSMTGYVNGSIWGVGAGAGEQKLHYLFASDTDFILAVWAEEMGLVGTLFVVALFVALLMFSVRIATHASDLFGTLLVTGIAGLIVFQAAFNMAVTIGLLPTKGLVLPFISRGGTSQIAMMAMMGILINIGLQAEPPKPKVVQPVPQT